MNVAVGIDFGTTNSVAAVFKNGEAEALKNDREEQLTPSCVAFDNEKVLIGKKALNHTDAKNKIYGIKRIIGLNYDAAERVKESNDWPFELKNMVDTAQIQVSFMEEECGFLAEEISALVLEELKSIVKSRLNKQNISAVITVPTYFSPKRRAAIEDAAKVAGIEVLRLLNESTAAAIAYDVLKTNPESRRRIVLVFDLGGGTLDITIVEIVGRRHVVKGHAGDLYLGGDDFTKRLADEIKTQMISTGFTLNDDVVLEISKEAEKMKKKLSFETRDRFEMIVGGRSFASSFTRPRLAEIYEELSQKAMGCVERALGEAKISRKQVNDVVLVGGSVRIPKIREMLEGIFGQEKIKFSEEYCDQLVAKGAAILASHISVGHRSGLEGLEFADVLPLSLGTDVTDDKTSIIIPRQTILPARATRRYRKVQSDKSEIVLKVCQGGNDKFSLNEFLYELRIPITLSESREEEIQLTFDVDRSGLLSITATKNDEGNRNLREKIDLAEHHSEEAIEEQRDRLKKIKKRLLRLQIEVEFMEEARDDLRRFAQTVRRRTGDSDRILRQTCENILNRIEEDMRNELVLNNVEIVSEMIRNYTEKKRELKRMEENRNAIDVQVPINRLY